MKVLLTGAFGNVGKSTLNALISRGYAVRVFDVDTPQNQSHAESYMDNPQVEIAWGDLRKKEDVLRAVDDTIDVIIHLAAIIPPLADKEPELAKSVNVGGTKNILEAIEAQDDPPRLIYTSSISVYGDRINNPFIQVTDPAIPNEDDEYARTKLASEKLIHNADITWAIFRLTYIVSPDRLQMDPLMFHMPLETCIEICHTEDAGLALANAVECNDIWGTICHIAGGEKCRTTYRDYVEHMMDIFGLGRNWLPEEAFSTGKFHCGFMDTTHSQNLLHYQHRTLEDYYSEVRKKTGYKRWIGWIFRWMARAYLVSRSRFYWNHLKNNIGWPSR
jgi:nucleoside-diphosphate-sugar epimerase